MKRALKILTALDLVFVLMLALSGSVGGALGDVVYILAFGVPLFLGMLASRDLKRSREEEAGIAEVEFISFGITRQGIKRFIPLILPTVALVFLAAWLTSLLLNALGFTGSTVADQPFILQLLAHALAPAVLEELLFRYLPIKLLYRYSPRGCVLISALFFALIHLDLYKMPYAFLAGVIFAMVDIAYRSILPSLVIHFLNNACSLATMKFGGVPDFLPVFYTCAAVLLAVSLVFVVIWRRDYITAARSAMEKGRPEYDRSALLLVITCVGVALINIIF